jgi:hypothetical protein
MIDANGVNTSDTQTRVALRSATFRIDSSAGFDVARCLFYYRIEIASLDLGRRNYALVSIEAFTAAL